MKIEDRLESRNRERVVDVNAIRGERCKCGALRVDHIGVFQHGACPDTHCERYTWKAFVDKDGNPL